MPDHRARQMLTVLGRQYPDVWRMVDLLREQRGNGLPSWPQWCFLPLHGAYAIAERVCAGAPRSAMPYLVAVIGALATWRVSQGIYRFDPVLYESLLDTPLDRDLPRDSLYRLPEWCVYVETPGMLWTGLGEKRPLHGFWAHLDWDERRPDQPHDELRLLLDTAASAADVLQPYACIPLPVILGQGSLADAMERLTDSALEQANGRGLSLLGERSQMLAELRKMVPKLWPIVSLLLYLCAEDADGVPIGLARPQPKQTRRGMRLFAPDSPRVWDIGVRLGAALRRHYHAEEVAHRDSGDAPERARPRAHIRRAHWHTFLAGPARSERRIRWLPPIPVNVDDLDTLPSTVRPIKPGS
jgi:hypothetical protein